MSYTNGSIALIKMTKIARYISLVNNWILSNWGELAKKEAILEQLKSLSSNEKRWIRFWIQFLNSQALNTFFRRLMYLYVPLRGVDFNLE